MKKTVLLLALLAASFSAKAALENRMWNSLITVVPGYWQTLEGDLHFIPGYDGCGAGWYVEVYDVTTGKAMSGNNTAMLGWFDDIPGYGSGYVVGGFVFGPAKEGDIVQLRLYDNSYIGGASWIMVSGNYTLPDLNDPYFPGEADVTFVMPIPEPATALLFGIGGMGAWLLRRNLLKARAIHN